MVGHSLGDGGQGSLWVHSILHCPSGLSDLCIYLGHLSLAFSSPWQFRAVLCSVLRVVVGLGDVLLKGIYIKGCLY